MEGSLWRIDPDSGVARQLTNGPGYDYQPDWSPDGRLLAYSTYRDDAVELRALDLASGRTWPLHGEPARSTSSRAGRPTAVGSPSCPRRTRAGFHVFVLEAADGRPGSRVRLTEDRDSGLPRYYYSRFDHYLSPTWSPDGTGARPRLQPRTHLGHRRPLAHEGRAGCADAPRPLRGDELEGAARLGARRHGASSMRRTSAGSGTSSGSRPPRAATSFPLTYGDFDATAPRWSPDGARIAYVSNEDGIPVALDDRPSRAASGGGSRSASGGTWARWAACVSRSRR